jgi:Zn-dependent peptidase ImmA (M78 family)
MIRAPIHPKLLRWARDRAGISLSDLTSHFPKLGKWEAGEVLPTLKQREGFARATHVPIGYLFLPSPPAEPLPIPDFRTLAGRQISHPSPNLLDTLYVCQERQSWYREHARGMGQPPLGFVGSVTARVAPATVAERMRQTLGFAVEARRDCATWTEALRRFIAKADEAGILVMISGIVLNNTHRPLNPEEFRGFALADPLAPLVFINGADTKAAQMFTLAHELAHLWLGASALSDAGADALPNHTTERWCNQVAAEFLVPLEALRAELVAGEALHKSVGRLARRFKVSTLVILRRLLDVGHLDGDTFQHAYSEELRQLADKPKGAGGDFHLTSAVRLGRRFARALVESTLEGHTLYRDAFRMVGISKTETFHALGRSLEIEP